MYSILNMSWSDVLNSDLYFKCNSQKRIIEMNGADMEDFFSKESSILIFYNLHTKLPMMLVEKVFFHEKPIEISKSDLSCKGFNVTVNEVEDDADCKEIVLVHTDILSAIRAEELNADNADSPTAN